MDHYDVVIVGGAALGSSVACHLARDNAFHGRILVIEKDPSYARAASALSAASIRQQFSSAINIDISLAGIAFLREVRMLLEVDGERPDIGLKEGGYLYLATQAGASVLTEINALQRARGADIALLPRAALAARFPWLRCDDLAASGGAGAFGLTGEGWFDGWGLMQALRRKARALGVQYRTGEVVGVSRTGARVRSVGLADGTDIGCGWLVDCAGASGGRALALAAGIDLPVYAKKRCVFSFSCRESLPSFPLLVDPSGVWCRPEGHGYICGYSPDDLDATDCGDDFEVDGAIFEETIWPALAHRVRAFEAIRPGRAWAGHYDMNLFDHNAFVGPAEDLDNMLFALGFSGHGLQQAPAVGRALAEWIAHGRYTTLDLTPLGPARLARGQPVLERNVI